MISQRVLGVVVMSIGDQHAVTSLVSMASHKRPDASASTLVERQARLTKVTRQVIITLGDRHLGRHTSRRKNLSPGLGKQIAIARERKNQPLAIASDLLQVLPHNQRHWQHQRLALGRLSFSRHEPQPTMRAGRVTGRALRIEAHARVVTAPAERRSGGVVRGKVLQPSTVIEQHHHQRSPVIGR